VEQRVSYLVGDAETGVLGRAAALAARHLTVLLLAYGLVVAAIGAVQLDRTIQGAANGLNSERQGGMFASMDVVDAHGPPLVGLDSSGDNSSFYPVALDDDRGTFIYIPLLAHYAGTHDLNVLLKWFFICFFVPLLLVYPLLIYGVTESVIAAGVAPWILLSNSSFFRTSGIFWIPAWANLLLLPLLLLIAKRWRPNLLWALVALAVLGSFASSMRANAGLGFVGGAILLVLLRLPRWRLRLAGVALIALAYLSISSFAIHAVQVQRDAVVGHDFTSPYPNGHPFWHNGYIGLGYLRNPYGFRPTDAAALAAAHRQDPGARFPTKRYERALRTVYLDTLEKHPWFVVHGWIVKAGVMLGLVAHWYPFAVLLVPLLLLFGAERRRRRFQFSLVVFAGLVGAATGVFTLPTKIPEIQSGWYGFGLFLWILSIGWAARPAEQWVAAYLRRWGANRQERRRELPPSWAPVLTRLRWQVRRRVVGTLLGARLLLTRAATWAVGGARGLGFRTLGRLALAAAVAAGVFLANSSGRITDASAAYWANEASLVDAASIDGTLVSRWQFDQGVPRGWREFARSVERRGDELHVRTRPTKYGLQLLSPPRVLKPGHYVAAVEGSVGAGGLQVAAADTPIDATVAYVFYSADAPFAESRRMALSFDLAKPTRVSILLSNFSVLARSSTWTLRSVVLRREPGGCQLNLPSAYYTPATMVAQ
jgi:hypothetical protein